MRSYHDACDGFSLAALEQRVLQGSLAGLNACVECCDRWYLTGCRNDDIITSAGYRIVPVDLEGAIIEHSLVAEDAEWQGATLRAAAT